jgi:hypothetical protein
MAIPGTINGKGYNFGYSVKEAKDQEIGFVRTTGNFADLMADGTEDAWVSSELGPSGTLHLTGDGSGSIDATLDPGSGMSLAAVRVTGSWQCGQKAAANGAAPSGDNSPLPGEPAVFTGVSPADSGGPDWAPIAGVAAATGGIIGGGLFLGRRRPPVTGPDAVPLYAVPPLGPADPTPWQAQAPAPPDAPPPDSPPTDLPQPQGPPQVLVDGPQAIDILKHEGWVEEVPRPDGSIGYRPKGTLRQYNDTPQGTPVLEHQPVVDGTVVRNLNGIAFNENPDGTFDCISLVVTQEPAPVPLPAAPAPVPATSQSTDTTPPERNELGLSDEGLVTAQVVNDMIRQADLDEEQREQEERIRLFQQQLTHPPTSPPSPPTPATPQNSAQLLQALGQPGRTVVTPDTMRTLAHELAPDSITSNGTIVATGAPLPAPSIAGGAMSVQVKGYPVETLGGLGPTLNVDVQVNGTLNVQGGQLGGRVTATGPGGFSKTFPNEAINKGLAPYNDAISKAHLSVKSVTLDNGQITIETVPQ